MAYIDTMNVKGTTYDIRDNGAEGAIAIMATGDTHAKIDSGQFVYVKGHSSLSEGLYKATAAINANGALSTSNLSAQSSGAANALQSQIDTLNSKFPFNVFYTELPVTSMSSWQEQNHTVSGTVLFAIATPSVRSLGSEPIQLYTTFSGNTVTVHYKNTTDWVGDGYSILILYA